MTRAGLVWTVRLPDASVTVDPAGHVLTVDAADVAVVDGRPPPAGTVPATVSLRMTWKGHGRRRQLTGTAPPFAGDFFRRVTARMTVSGSEDGFAFSSLAARPARAGFALLGTEQNGLFLSAAAVCPRCSTRWTLASP